jgi:exopolyphosphatase/guanosine-5'-triphosphate,3'-diphosphate pyrophosphatase
MKYEQIAAVDLGSNSFRLQVGRVVDGEVYPLDSVKETVRLASGLQPDKTLDQDSIARALEALSRFGERLRGFSAEGVRAVATNTLRVAKNAPAFLRQAEAALGFPIEVIAGREEARLIFLGAAHSLPAAAHKRLVVDIGGGSTEFVIGKRYEPQLLESLYMGCVSFSTRFFPGGQVEKRAFREAEIEAAAEIEQIVGHYRAHGWKEAVGSSGSAAAICELLEQNGFNPGGVTGITAAGLMRLKTQLLKAGNVDGLSLAGLRADRAPVLPGGLAIMMAVFDRFGLDRMTYADGALRLGVLYDLLGRFRHEDRRDSTIAEFQRRYQVDIAQAQRVETLAGTLLRQLMPTPSAEAEHDAQFLGWAARLHELGISVAHSAHHKHGAYILTYADMPGFSKTDQGRLAQLVLGHRGKLDKVAVLPGVDDNWHLLLCLRLAVLFHRSRAEYTLPRLGVSETLEGYALEVQSGWLRDNPLTAAAIEDECALWARVGIPLTLRETREPRARAAVRAE